jgi:hypothetical protein
LNLKYHTRTDLAIIRVIVMFWPAGGPGPSRTVLSQAAGRALEGLDGPRAPTESMAL